MTSQRTPVTPLSEREAHLAKVPFFEGLTGDALRLVLGVATDESYVAGARIFQRGDVGDKLYLVQVGKVRLSFLGKELGGSGDAELAWLDPGEFFGEMALIDESKRETDAFAQEPCTLLVVTKDAFDDLLFIHKDLAYEILWEAVRILAARVRETECKLRIFSTNQGF